MKTLAVAGAVLLFAAPVHAFWGWGKYGSKAEASSACDAWVSEEKGELIVRVHANGSTWLSADHGVRYCDHEPETNQVLGYGRPDYIPGKIIEKGDPYPESKVLKRFRY